MPIVGRRHAAAAVDALANVLAVQGTVQVLPASHVLFYADSWGSAPIISVESWASGGPPDTWWNKRRRRRGNDEEVCVLGGRSGAKRAGRSGGSSQRWTGRPEAPRAPLWPKALLHRRRLPTITKPRIHATRPLSAPGRRAPPAIRPPGALRRKLGLRSPGSGTCAVQPFAPPAADVMMCVCVMLQPADGGGQGTHAISVCSTAGRLP